MSGPSALDLAPLQDRFSQLNTAFTRAAAPKQRPVNHDVRPLTQNQP